jgi:hypothetical protein
VSGHGICAARNVEDPRTTYVVVLRYRYARADNSLGDKPDEGRCRRFYFFPCSLRNLPQEHVYDIYVLCS